VRETQRPSAIVTGGSRGIGRGIATMLALRGWDLTVTARGADALEALSLELAETGVSVRAVAGDIGDEQHIAELVAGHISDFGHVNALVLAAGIGSAAPIDGYPSKRLDRQLDVNFRSPFLLTAAALSSLRSSAQSRPDGVSRVIAIASIEGLHPEPGLAAYGATKAALISLIESINAEERANGVVATAICPGFVDTDMSDWVADVIGKATMLTIADVVRCVELTLDLSANAVLPQIVLQRRLAEAGHA
jgi:3-oxoacyl-[acyl-carrier protein] reductase